MNQDTINRYQPGGDIYASLAQMYGTNAANAIASAAATGVQTNITDAIAAVKYGSPLDSSLLDSLASQLYNDPLGAPFEQAGTVLSNTADAAGNAAKRVASAAIGNWGVWLIGGLVVAGFFFYLGGADVLRRRIAK